MTLVVMFALIKTVAYSVVTVVEPVTDVVTPPYVHGPGLRVVEVAEGTTVLLDSVTVLAGKVYVPGVGHTVTIGVGTGA